ncbi:hypothetical protein BJX99DRAFT_254728 [Aspergillus californicus]
MDGAPDTTPKDQAPAMARTGEISLRRRLQNRVAQRRFRENAKLRKKSKAKQHPAQPSELLDMDNQDQFYPQSNRSVNPANGGFDSASLWDCDIPLPDLYPNDTERPGVFPSTADLFTHNKPVHPFSRPYQPGSQIPRRRDPIQTLPRQEFSAYNGGLQIPPPENLKLPSQEKALATLARQKAMFRDEAKELFDQLYELHHLVVVLDLLPQDSQFVQLLSTTRERFYFSLGMPEPTGPVDPFRKDDAADIHTSSDSGGD